MRILKDPDIRRAEILDVAEQLFTIKGYAKTTVIDILEAAGIAKGTLYYYYKSKEEVMDAVIRRMVEADALAAEEIASRTDLTPFEKFHHILLGQKPRAGGTKVKLLEQFHHSANAEMHQKSLVLGVRALSPILGRIAEEGVDLGVFTTPYPRETTEFLLTAGQVLLDEGMFQWSPEELAAKAKAFIHIMEVSLGAEPGSFAFMGEILG